MPPCPRLIKRQAPTDSLPVSLPILLPLALSLLALPPTTRWGWSLKNLHGSPAVSALIRLDDGLPGLLPSVAFSLVAYYGTLAAVGACRDVFRQRGFKGKDLLKPGARDYIPETLGLPASCVYLLVLFLFIPFRYYVSTHQIDRDAQRTSTDGGWFGDISGRSGFPHHELAIYLSALLSLLSSLILGFCDDVFDIRWRFKMPIPIVASIPMLLVYYAGQGGTGLVVPGWPAFLRTLVGSSVIDIGFFYYLFISLLSTFCTHSINILAGINGVEVGQALIIATSLCINDALYLPIRAAMSPFQPATQSTLQNELVGRHLFSLSLMLPLVGTCAGLLAWNRHPSLVFVGDTFCYFAGQALACAGVLGHFSKTLLLFFLPQVFNFLLSCPQLFGFVPCPRHRVPKVHQETMQLYPSLAIFPDAKPAKPLGILMLRILETLRFVVLYREYDLPSRQESQKQGKTNGSAYQGRGRIVATTNLTLLNTILVVAGVRGSPQDAQSRFDAENNSSSRDTKESTSTTVAVAATPPQPPQGPHIDELKLWRMTMGVQLLGSAVAFAIRYWAAAAVFPQP